MKTFKESVIPKPNTLKVRHERPAGRKTDLPRSTILPSKAKAKKPAKAEKADDPKDGIRTKCTPKLIEQFCDLVAEGHPAGTICNYLGITNTAFHSWIRKGEEFVNSLGEMDEYAIYGKFVKDYKKAASSYLIARHRILHGTADKNWYREVVILERRDKKNWSKDAPPGGSDEQYQSDEKFV